MAQTTILGRIGQLVRANVNSLLDQAEDPEKMLDQLIRDFTNNMAEAEDAVAQTIGNLRMLEDDAKEAREAAARVGRQGGRRVATAPTSCAPRATRPRPTGSTASPRSRSAARSASRSRSRRSTRRSPSRPSSSTNLKDGLNKLRVKREELVQKRDELVSRAKMAARRGCRCSRRSRNVSVMDPTSELVALRGADPTPGGAGARHGGGQPSSLDDQFAEPRERRGASIEVDARLAALKGKALPSGAPALSSGGTGA